MTSDTSKPPIECDVDLTDFPFMPILIARLKHSRAWLICKRKPELAFYMLNLWTACWHGRPAGSIEDDDLVLADLAMCSDKVWAKIKEDVLRGWIRCSDGRLYHPVVVEQAKEAWTRKSSRRAQTEAARVAREATRAAAEAKRQERLRNETEDATVSVTENETEDVTPSKGQGQGQGQGKDTAVRASASRSSLEIACRSLVGEEPVLLAQDFYVLEALLDEGITEDDIRTGISEALEKRSDPRRRFRYWESFSKWCRTAAQNRMAAAPTKSPGKNGSAPKDDDEPTFDFGCGFTPAYSLIRSVWGRNKWLPDWGPRPDEPGCRIPPDLLAEIMGAVPA